MSSGQEITSPTVFMQTRSILVFFLGILEKYLRKGVSFIFPVSKLELRFSPIQSNFQCCPEVNLSEVRF